MSDTTRNAQDSSPRMQQPCPWCGLWPCICEMIEVITTEVLKIEYPPSEEPERRPYDF